MKSLIAGCVALFTLFAVAFIMTENTEKRLTARINRQSQTIERLQAALAKCERKRVRLTIHYHVVETTGYTTGPESCGKWADVNQQLPETMLFACMNSVEKKSMNSVGYSFVDMPRQIGIMLCYLFQIFADLCP